MFWSVAVALILLSTLQGDDDLAVSNVVGSNIVNVLVVLVGLPWGAWPVGSLSSAGRSAVGRPRS